MINTFSCTRLFAHKKLHLGVSGSVACYKACDLLRRLLELDMQTSCVLSAGARHFITPLLLESLGANPVYGEMFAGDKALDHLEPGRVADAMAIVPASANTLAKLAWGMADNMLTAQFLAFPGNRVVAPAMNPRMWVSAAVQENVEKLRQHGCKIVFPAFGRTACGEEGQGRLADLDEIFFAVLESLSPKDMQWRRVMVTLGPTREHWDGARFWSNPSTGRMGGALAVAAWLRGAKVTAICGPGVDVVMPLGIEKINVTSAREMFEAAQDTWPGVDIGIFTAAVADFAPAPPDCGQGKFKKDSLGGAPLVLKFHQNPDILATFGQNKAPGKKVLGFAAETTANIEDLLPLARIKLERKGADMIAANRINGDSGAFGADNAILAVADAQGREEIWQPMPKSDAAWELLTWLLQT